MSMALNVIHRDTITNKAIVSEEKTTKNQTIKQKKQ